MRRRIVISLLVGMLAVAGIAAAIALLVGLFGVVRAIVDLIAPTITEAGRATLAGVVFISVVMGLAVALAAFDLLGESER